jgi:hypothetical protein
MPGLDLSADLAVIEPRFRWYPFQLPVQQASDGEITLTKAATGLFRLGRDASPSPSLLTGSLTVAANEVRARADDDRVAGLDMLNYVRPIGRVLPTWIFRSLALVLVGCISGAVAQSLISAGSRQTNNVPLAIGIGLLGLALLWLALALYVYPVARLHFYWRALGLPSFDYGPIARLRRGSGEVLFRLLNRKGRPPLRKMVRSDTEPPAPQHAE